MELSVIIPVYREQKTILQGLRALAAVNLPDSCEILVVDGDHHASTLSFLEKISLPVKGLRMIRAQRGRGPQMNAGAEAAEGRLLFFLHADSRPEKAGVEKMVEAWQSRKSNLFCGAFDLGIDSPCPVFRIIERTASFRSRVTRIPYGDQGIFISRALFEQVRGFPDQPLMEDVGLMAAVRRTGTRPVFIENKMHTSARRWEKRGIVSATLSNWIFISLYASGVSTERLAKWYYS